ncbi:MAG: radical SAM/SPASM domain-containing protein [Pseudobdellovibrionaceae bacterium]
MKSVFLQSDTQAQEFFDTVLKRPENELIVIGFRDSDLMKSHFPKVFELGSRFSKIFMQARDSDFEFLHGHMEQLLASKIGLCVELEVIPPAKGEVDKDLYRTTPAEIFSQACEDFHKWRFLFPEVRVAYELHFEKENIPLLAPTLQHLSLFEPPFIFLNPQSLSWDCAEEVKNQLLHYQIYADKVCYVYFSPDHPYAEEWNARTENVLSGPKMIDVDLSNFCTHNCNFCGLYADEAVALEIKKAGGSEPELVMKYKRSKLDYEKARRLISELPDSTGTLTFGGAGDPMTHPQFFELVEMALKRGFLVTVISNFAYFNDEKIRRLSELAAENPYSVFFQVNLSAGRAETYVKTRPNQTAKTFDRVVGHLKLSADLRLKQGRGLFHRLINVTTRENYHDICELIGIGKYVHSLDVWIKPLEIHGEITKRLLIHQEDLPDYAMKVKLALYFADQLGVVLFDRMTMEKIVEDQKEEIAKLEKIRNFENRLQDELDNSFHLKREMLAKNPTHHPDFSKVYASFQIFFNSRFNGVGSSIETPPVVKVKAEKVMANYGGKASASIPATYFSNMPCHIGYFYLRITTDANWLPCCISDLPVNRQKDASLLNAWLSGQLVNFRNKLKGIHKEKFHMTDPQWTFCQQCVHRPINEEYNRKVGFELVL